jgi:hypothetical protein
MKAKDEISKLVQKYKDNPTYLRLLALHLNGASEKAYSNHLKQLEASRPENQERARMKREIKEEVYRELGIGDND